MSDEVKPDQPQEPKPEPAAEKETTSPETEDKPTPLPTLVDKENQHAQPTFKKPFDAKPQLTPEKMEEAKLSAKYGKLKPGGSDFLRKKINKGVKYFDSGDYNMEKQSGKLKLRPGSGKPPGLAGAARLGGAQPVISPLGTATGKTIPTPATIPHRKQSTEISKLAV